VNKCLRIVNFENSANTQASVYSQKALRRNILKIWNSQE